MEDTILNDATLVGTGFIVHQNFIIQ